MAVADPCVSILLTGDVMLGRGIDQILPYPSDPLLYETYASSAQDYVRLAAKRNGPVPCPVPFDYVWGEAPAEIDRQAPDLRIVNLETAVTTASAPEQKGINYRMSPANIAALTAIQVDACVLANNHVGDWGRSGITETLDVLHGRGIATVGAGRDADDAAAPAILPVAGKCRVILLALGSTTSGIPCAWEARRGRPGVHLLPETPEEAISVVRSIVQPIRMPGDIVVVSIHWGDNWGYDVSERQRETAHGLIEQAGVNVLHGHSSHHPRPIEINNGKLVLYGCGDFINDYEGISGYEKYRGDLTLAYVARVAVKDGTLQELCMLPFRIRRFRLERATEADGCWLAAMLNRVSVRFGSWIELERQAEDGALLRLSRRPVTG